MSMNGILILCVQDNNAKRDSSIVADNYKCKLFQVFCLNYYFKKMMMLSIIFMGIYAKQVD